jgi:APA family basic amino acid/polyamine antiporter
LALSASGSERFRPVANIGLWSGIGLGVANMVGVGVLTSNAYMARSLGSTAILAIWLIQGLLALAGARTYAALATLEPTSGGEYRYLSEFLHPLFGAFAGWTSMVVGFAAPVAASAYVASAFVKEIVPDLPILPGAIVIVVLFTFAAAGRLTLAKGTQDALVLVKLVLLSAFVLLGLTRGKHGWPAQATSFNQSSLSPFVMNLYYAAYAYSGWNAAAYVAGAFRSPARTVPRAMVGGTLLTTAFYLLMAYVFLANLGSSDLAGWSETRVTLAHLLVQKLAGPQAAIAASIGIVIVLASCISAMMLTGPSVTSAMAHDGFLPRWLAVSRVRPNASPVLLQGGLAVALLLTSSFEKLIAGMGVVLTASSALCALALLRVARRRPGAVATSARIAASLYLAAASAEVAMAIWIFPRALLWLLGLAVVTVLGYRRAPGSRSARNRGLSVF